MKKWGKIFLSGIFLVIISCLAWLMFQRISNISPCEKMKRRLQIDYTQDPALVDAYLRSIRMSDESIKTVIDHMIFDAIDKHKNELIEPFRTQQKAGWRIFQDRCQKVLNEIDYHPAEKG